LSGQISGTITLDKTVPGPEGLSVEGCQVGQESTQILLNLPNSKLTVKGHSTSVKSVQVTVNVAKNGNAEKVTATSNAEVAFIFKTGSKVNIWRSDSGTVTTKSKGNGGSFSTGIVPQTGTATGVTKMSGSYSSCHAFG
jgi:hypothetical protein